MEDFSCKVRLCYCITIAHERNAHQKTTVAGSPGSSCSGAWGATSQNQNFTPIFVPFPGYNNLDTKKQIINPANNDGNSDTFISPSTHLAFLPQQLEYKEYSFSIDQLSPFKSYRIKIVMTSTNQVYSPRFKDLRVITLA